MPFSDLLTTKASVETMAISGRLQVEIRSQVPPLALALEVAGMAWYGWFVWTFLHHPAVSWFHLVPLLLTLISGAAGVVYQVSHSETIIFDGQNLTIRRHVLGWAYTRRYPAEKCRELSWCVQDNAKFGLECKVGWRTIRFGHNASEEQARNILEVLQRDLRQLAEKFGRMPGGRGREQITRLGLS